MVCALLTFLQGRAPVAPGSHRGIGSVRPYRPAQIGVSGPSPNRHMKVELFFRQHRLFPGADVVEQENAVTGAYGLKPEYLEDRTAHARLRRLGLRTGIAFVARVKDAKGWTGGQRNANQNRRDPYHRAK